jgi:AcrR family transcriptional regulator
MARWEPDARGRLEEAAMELYREQGYDQTTVAAIAARAGLTERTFFRHYADKREVLFGGGDAFQASILDALGRVPRSSPPLEAVMSGLESTAAFLDQRRDFARQRSALIEAHAELREREVMKLNSVAAAIAEALRGRGVPEPAASLSAEAGVAVYKVAFERWVGDRKRRGLTDHIRAALAELRVVTAKATPRQRR